MKLVGVMNIFIYVLFLWIGIWYGIIGGLFFFICVVLMMWWLGVVVSEVVGVYEISFDLIGLILVEFVILVVFVIGLGFVGFYLFVNCYIKEIEFDKV